MSEEAPPARADWERRIGLRSSPGVRGLGPAGGRLPAPQEVVAQAGAGQVTLDWTAVPGACGYLVSRGNGPDGPFSPLDHGGGDVLAVPGPPYGDTTGVPRRRYWYTITALQDVDRPPGEPSEAVAAAALVGGREPARVTLTVRCDHVDGRLRRLWHMVGSERLSQLLSEESTGGRPVAEEFAEALRLAHAELGATHVRAHAVLHDDLGVYREGQDGPELDFRRVERVYDELLGLGLRPVVELSFMPAALARDPGATVFDYAAVVSPPRDWARWAELSGALAAHLVQRYGVEEVGGWGFEVWNEANLEVFWSGDQQEYLELYERAARAVKAVDARLQVGGPATAAGGWIADFLDAVQARGLPLDFLSTHTYGNAVLDLREALRARGMDEVAVWWTEWGITPTHFAAVTDGAFGAPFILHGMKRAQTSADALAYWVVSDHFEELGRPSSLVHGGFGLLTVGNLRKPRWWALRLAEQLGEALCEAVLDGDGARSLVDAWASRAPDGRIDVLVWNGTLDQSKVMGGPRLDRLVSVRLEGLASAAYRGTLARVDAEHSNLVSRWDSGRDWPTGDEWAELRAADRLHETELGALEPSAGVLSLALHLPMPGVLRLRLQPG